MLASANTASQARFHRPELTVGCLSRGLTLTEPDRDGLLNACEAGEQRRPLRYREEVDARAALGVEWGRLPCEALQPAEVVATLNRDGILVELSYPQRGGLPSGW